MLKVAVGKTFNWHNKNSEIINLPRRFKSYNISIPYNLLNPENCFS